MATVQLSLPFHVISKLSDEEKCKLIVQQCILLQVEDWEIRCLLQLCSKKGKVSKGMTLVYRFAGLVDEIREEISELMEILVSKAFGDSNQFQFPLSGDFHRELLLSLLRLIGSLSEWRKLQWMPRPIIFDADGSLIALSSFFERLIKYFTLTLRQQSQATINDYDFKTNLSFLIHSCSSTYFELDSVDLASVLHLISDVMEMELRIETKWQEIITLPTVKFPLAVLCLPYPGMNQFIEQNRWFTSTFSTYSTVISRIEDILLHVFNFYNRTNQISLVYNSFYNMRNSKVVGDFFCGHVQRNVTYLSERNAFALAGISPLTLRSSWIPYLMSSLHQMESHAVNIVVSPALSHSQSQSPQASEPRTTNDLLAPTTIEVVCKFSEEESIEKVESSSLEDKAKVVEAPSLQSSPGLQHRSTLTVVAIDPVLVTEDEVAPLTNGSTTNVEKPTLFQRRSNSTASITPHHAPHIVHPPSASSADDHDEADHDGGDHDEDEDCDDNNEEIIYYVRYDPKRDHTPEQAIETMLKAANSNDANDFSRPRSLSNYAATPTNDGSGNAYNSGRIVRSGNNNRPRVYSADSQPLHRPQHRHSNPNPDRSNYYHHSSSSNHSPNFSSHKNNNNSNSSSSRPASFTTNSRRKFGSNHSAYSSPYSLHSPVPSSGMKSGWSARSRLRGIDFSAQSLASALRAIDELDETFEDRAARKIGIWFKLVAPRRKLLRRLSHRDLMADVINLLLDKTVQQVTIREKRRHRLLRHGAAIKLQKCYRQWQQYMLEQERIQEQERRSAKAWQLLDELRRCVKNAIRIQRYIKYAIRKKLMRKDRKRGRIPPTIGEIIDLYMMQFSYAKRAGLYQNISKRMSRGQSLLMMQDTRRKDVYRNLDRAATKIQTIYRGFVVRKDIVKRKLELFMARKLIIFIIRCTRERRMRKKRLVHKSSTVIQKFFRGISARRKLFRIVHSGLALNQLWRKHQAYRGLKSQLRRLDRPITITVHGLRNIPKKSLLTDELHMKVSVWWNPLLHIMGESDSIEITLTKSPQYIYTGVCHKVTTEDDQVVPELVHRGLRVFDSVISQAGRFVHGMRNQTHMLRNSGSNSPPPSRLSSVNETAPAAAPGPPNNNNPRAKAHPAHDRHNTAPPAMIHSPPSSSASSSPQILSFSSKSNSKKAMITSALPPVRAPPAAAAAAAMMLNSNNNGGMMRPKTVSFDGGGGGSGKLNPLPQVRTSPSNGSGKGGILKKPEPAVAPSSSSSSAKVAVVTRERNDSSTSSDEEKKDDSAIEEKVDEVKVKPKFDPKAAKLLSSHIKRRLSMKFEAAKLLEDPNYVKKTETPAHDALDEDDDDDDDDEEDENGDAKKNPNNMRLTAVRQAMTFAFGLSNMAKKTAIRKRTKLICNFEDETLKIPGCHGNSVIKFEIFDGERKLSSMVFQLRKEGGMLYWGGEYTRSCSIIHQRRAIQFNANIIQAGAAHAETSIKSGGSMLLDFRVVAGAPLRSKCGWARLLCRGKGPLKRALQNRDFMASFSLFDQWHRFYCSFDEFGLFLFNNKFDTQPFFVIPCKELLSVVVDSNAIGGSTGSKSIVEDLNNVIVKTQPGDELFLRFPDSASRNSWTEVLQNTIAFENRNGKVKAERTGGPRQGSWLPFSTHLRNTSEESEGHNHEDDRSNSPPPPSSSGSLMASPLLGTSPAMRSGKHILSGSLSSPSGGSSSNIMASPNVVNRKQRTPPIFSVPFKPLTDNSDNNSPPKGNT